MKSRTTFQLERGYYFQLRDQIGPSINTINLISRSINASSGEKNILYSANTKLSTNYIDMPLNLVYSLPVHKKTRFIIGAGPMFSFLYSTHADFSTVSFSYDPGQEFIKAHFEKEFIDLPVGKLPGRVKVFHLGWNAFAGFDFGKVSLTANYSKDINDFLEENGRKNKHETFGLTLGWNIEAMGINNNN